MTTEIKSRTANMNRNPYETENSLAECVVVDMYSIIYIEKGPNVFRTTRASVSVQFEDAL